jgi:DNA adenine methylase
VLSSYWSNQYNRYVEPFAGSACLFFRLRPKQAILGDLNAELIATYREVKHRLPAVISALRKLKKSRIEYLKLRATEPLSLTPSARAARFIYLNRFCFNGLYRTNRSGQFNVPYGGDKSGNIPSESFLKNCSRFLKNAALFAGDFEKILKKVRSGDFVYMDPPFSVNARRVFNEYDAAIFGLEDLQRLRRWMEILAEMNIKFLVSYAECDEADFLRKGFHTEVVTVKRHIAGFTESRLYSNELLISNAR